MKLRDNGFTLIEMLVVVAILALLSGLAVPRVFGQVEQARTTAAITDYGTIGKALSLSMLQEDTVPAQDAIRYLREWPEKNPWGGSYALSSNEEYTANKYIRLAMNNVPEASFQSLKAKMGDLVEKGSNGLVYMYLEGTGGSTGGEGPEEPASMDSSNPKSVFHYVGYSAGSITFANSPAINNADCAAVGTINKEHARAVPGKQEVQLPTFATMTSIKHTDRSVVRKTGSYVVGQNSNLSNQTLWVDGDLEVSPNNDFCNVTIYVTGSITLKNVNFNGNNNLIVAGHDIKATGNSTNFGKSLVIAYGEVQSTNTTIEGAIIAQGDIAFHGSTNLNYVKDVVDNCLAGK